MLVCMFSWEIKVQIYNKKSLNCMEAAGEERLMDLARIRTKDLVPTGFRFRPTDEELVCCYLKNKIEGNSLPCDIIVECELYGVKEPWEIWATFGGDHPDDDQDLNRFLYLFTRLKNMANRGSRIQRRVGSGSWKGERKADRVRAHQSGKCVGLKKRFHYENQRSMHHRRWLLDEYSLVPVKEHDYVLCRLINNGPGSRKRWRSSDSINEGEEESGDEVIIDSKRNSINDMIST
ncbi:NAC domain-containing protein 30-like [Carya illinoinensis]|uniref:NAC domain-containing protein 30-like n=1 Tax=Carya illinoinensis TaxID=32201 RepID=UPI001C71C22B|nr:NAC domain-containing protein 30-like [Carya illinoinensis]